MVNFIFKLYKPVFVFILMTTTWFFTSGNTIKAGKYGQEIFQGTKEAVLKNEKKILKSELIHQNVIKKEEITETQDKLQFIRLEKPTHESMVGDSCADILLLGNYVELKCRVLLVTDSIVEFKSCYDRRGISDTMFVRNLKMIRFQKDSVVFFDSEFKNDFYNPNCIDKIQFKNDSCIYVKILKLDNYVIKYVDCTEIGKIKRINVVETKEVVYKNTSINLMVKPTFGANLKNAVYADMFISTFWDLVLWLLASF